MALLADHVWRDFTTDGVPTSGKHEPSKSEIREWGRRVEGFLNLQTLLADSTQWDAGQILITLNEGFSYVVASSGAVDHHITTAGGIKLYVASVEKLFVRPEMFGADGTLANDTLAFQRLRDFVRANTTIYCYGRYQLGSANIVFTTKNHLTFVGGGTLVFNDLALHGLRFNQCHDLSIDGIELESTLTYALWNGYTVAEREVRRPGIYTVDCQRPRIHNIRAKKCRLPIMLENPVGFSVTGGRGIGVFPDIATVGGEDRFSNFCYVQAAFNGGDFSGNDAFGFGSNLLIGSGSIGLNVSNNTSRMMRDNGIYGSSCFLSNFTGNYCADISGTGLKVRGDDNSVIGNNTVRCVAGVTVSGLYDVSADGSNGHNVVVANNVTKDCQVGVFVDDIDLTDGVGPTRDQRSLSDVAVTGNQIYNCTSPTSSAVQVNARKGLVLKNNIIDGFLGTAGMYVAKHKVATAGNTEWLEGVEIDGNIIKNGPKAFEMTGLKGGKIAGGYVENMTFATVIKAQLYDCQDLTIQDIATSDPSYRLNTTTSTGKLKIFNTGFNMTNSLDTHWTQGNAADRNLVTATVTPAYNKQVTFNGAQLFMAVGTSAPADWKQIS